MSEGLSCPECGAPMVLRRSKYGPFYGCSTFPECYAAHGAHANGVPLGIPTDKETKEWRIKAHEAFDQLWKGKGAPMSRRKAYLLMGDLMDLPSEEVHIGRFTTDQCRELIGKLDRWEIQDDRSGECS